MDGVLADFEGGFLRKFRARFPDLPFVALEDRRGFWVSEQYDRLSPGLSEKAISIWESKNFFFELEPLPGAVEAVKQMANLQNTDVFICTSPIKMFKYCPYEKGLTTQLRLIAIFLSQPCQCWDYSMHHHAWFWWPALCTPASRARTASSTWVLVLVRQYAWVEKHFGPDFLEQIVLTRDKTIVSADLLIDDRLDIIGAEPHPSWEHILFTSCHNRHVWLPPSHRRLHSWADDWKAILDSKRTG